MTDIAVKGLKELDKFLSALPKNMQKGAYRAGLVAAAAVVRDEARLRAPKQTGLMARSIQTGSARQNQDGSFSIKVRFNAKTERGGNNHAFLGLFFEYGVAPHFIAAGDSGKSARLLTRSARDGDVLGDVETQALKIGDNFIPGAVMHPGMPARPFFRPALDAKADEAVKAFAERIRAYLEGKTGFDAGVVMGEAA